MAVKMAMVLADGVSAGLSGRILDDGSSAWAPFSGADGMAAALEAACDRDMAPFPQDRPRRFGGQAQAPGNRTAAPRYGGATENRRRFMKDTLENGPRGDLGSFLVCVQHRENGTMQGRVTWLDKGVTMPFRSAWELVRLIDDAVRDGSEPEPSWDGAEKA